VRHEEAVVRNFFERVLRWARKKSPRVPLLKLSVNCPLILRTHAKSPRAFMHTLHKPGKVCVASIAAGLHPEHLVALYIHEISHPLAQNAYGRSEQEDADQAAKEFLGVRILYKGPLLLEWVPISVVRKIVL
jgi:hypothetical protein